MGTILAPLVCYLLILSLKVAHLDTTDVSTTPANHGLELRDFTASSIPFNSTGTPTISSNATESTAEYSSTKLNNETFTTTVAAAEDTSQYTSLPGTVSTLPTLNTQSTVTKETIRTTTHFISTSETSGSSTVNSSHSITTSTYSVNSTEGVTLDTTERNLTIIFSSILGLFAVAIVTITFYKCRHKIQYLHQPLNPTDETDGLVADDDTLVISGGLYDGHPIYDHVPPPHAEQSQFCLEFLH